ncbi:hypothetical protein EHM92_07445 [bacterium]|nr:MAG: hypothetical protein EHM92_07445 [bacterium]
MLRDKERFDLVAHFPSAEKARTAETAFGGRLQQEGDVTFGFESWLGLGAGVVLGGVIGFLLYKDLLEIGFLPVSMGSREPLVTVLWAAILGASGWIMGSAIHLFSSTPGTDRYELHITIGAEKLAEMRKLLIAEGATAISIKEHGVIDSDAQTSERGHAAGPVRAHGN